MFPDIVSGDFQSLDIRPHGEDGDSFQLMGSEGADLSVKSAGELATRLGCDLALTRAKVVSVVGNSGEGKSHTLNHAFFDGKEVFRTHKEPQRYESQRITVLRVVLPDEGAALRAVVPDHAEPPDLEKPAAGVDLCVRVVLV